VYQWQALCTCNLRKIALDRASWSLKDNLSLLLFTKHVNCLIPVQSQPLNFSAGAGGSILSGEPTPNATNSLGCQHHEQEVEVGVNLVGGHGPIFEQDEGVGI